MLTRCLLTLVLLAWTLPASATESASAAHNIVLVTLDGVRVQEMFGGLDVGVLRAGLGENDTLEDNTLYQRYWAETPEERRVRIMPFFWNTLMREHGSIAGNAALGSRVQLTNALGFSYPGYTEILTGRAHDDAVTSNDNKRYPYPTVLEFAARKLALDPRQVATFASWETFNWIAESREGATFTNAGVEAYPVDDPLIAQLNALQGETQAFPATRLDAFTAELALSYLQRERPRVLLVAFNDTDEWAHRRNYGYTLAAIARADKFLERLWTWLQSQPQYRGNTTLVITTDHGRGNTPKDWGDHGKVEGAQNTWLAIASPLDDRRGEWRDAPTLHANQIAATLAAALGLDYAEQDPEAGTPIRMRRLLLD